MSTIKKGIRRLFSRKNLFFTVGLLLFLATGIVWLVGGGFGRTETTKAASSGFTETWMATKVLGDVANMDWGQGVPLITETDISLKRVFTGGTGQFFAVRDSSAWKSPNGSDNTGMLRSDGVVFVPIQWTVTGTVTTP